MSDERTVRRRLFLRAYGIDRKITIMIKKKKNHQTAITLGEPVTRTAISTHKHEKTERVALGLEHTVLGDAHGNATKRQRPRVRDDEWTGRHCLLPSRVLLLCPAACGTAGGSRRCTMLSLSIPTARDAGRIAKILPLERRRGGEKPAASAAELTYDFMRSVCRDANALYTRRCIRLL